MWNLLLLLCTGMCCDLILRRRLGKRGKRPQRAYERDGDFAGLLALDLGAEKFKTANSTRFTVI